ncbi:unnamed protein product [Phytomonas sp. EM1]|nr:unnamed protein product [Phytomonas sp. EM1]|eukprot:CCW61424.1 unnamed protein product [Phytomonas sp. isolate EM1]
MQILLAARQSFLAKGYAILHNVIEPSVVTKLRDAALIATRARPAVFKEVPSLESIFQVHSQRPNRIVDSQLKLQLEKRNFVLRHFKQAMKNKVKLRRIAKKYSNGRDMALLSGDELWELSKQLAQEAVSLSSVRHCTSTVDNDPQMLAAIDKYRANAWMTNPALGTILQSDVRLKTSLARLSEFVGGVEQPVIFGDIPLLREAFGNPIGYHITAPSIGVRTNTHGISNAVTLVLFTFDPSSSKLPLFVMENSHRCIVKQYIHDVPPCNLSSPFPPAESHVASQVKHFCLNSSVVGKFVDNMDAIRAGSVMVVDPHLLFGFGPNLSWEGEVVYKLNIVSKDAVPYLEAPSWIRGWRSFPQDINFDSPIVFPPLFQ